jgi:hypothetical protein
MHIPLALAKYPVKSVDMFWTALQGRDAAALLRTRQVEASRRFYKLPIGVRGICGLRRKSLAPGRVSYRAPSSKAMTQTQSCWVAPPRSAEDNRDKQWTIHFYCLSLM